MTALLALCPGQATPPGHYETLAARLRSTLGALVFVYHPPGIGARREDREPHRPEDLAEEILADPLAAAGSRIWIGHSWGAHVARRGALADGAAVAAVLVDPPLGLKGPPDPGDFDPPDRFPDRAALVALHARYGMTEDRIRWDLWLECEDGSLAADFDATTIRGHIRAAPWGPCVLEEIRALSERIPTAILRTAGQSIIDEAAWARLSREAPDAVLEVIPDVTHGLRPAEQETVAERIAAWIRETDPRMSGE